jgi:hypothetical protein
MASALNGTKPNYGTQLCPLSVPHTREVDEDEILAVSLQALQEYEENPVDEAEFIADKTKQFLDSVWNHWLK